MEEEYFYVIGLGNEEDWQAGRGSVYYIEDRNGEKGVPVFTAPEKAEQYIRANFHSPEAHMSMLESVPESHVEPLTRGRYVVMPLEAAGVVRAALLAEADYLVRDPRPGHEQEILRLG